MGGKLSGGGLGLGKSLGGKPAERSGDWSGLNTGWKSGPGEGEKPKTGGLKGLGLNLPKRPLGVSKKKAETESDAD